MFKNQPRKDSKRLHKILNPDCYLPDENHFKCMDVLTQFVFYIFCCDFSCFFSVSRERKITDQRFSEKSLRQRVIKSELKFHGQWTFKNWNFSISELNRSTNMIGTWSFHVWIYSDINNWRSKNRWTSLSPSVKFCQFSLLKIALSGILIWKNRSIINLSFRTFWTMLKFFVSLTILSPGRVRKECFMAAVCAILGVLRFWTWC